MILVIVVITTIFGIYGYQSFLESDTGKESIKNISDKITQTKNTLEEELENVKTVPIKVPQLESIPNPTKAARPEFDISEIESRIHQMTNQERNQHGLSSLNSDARLADIARKHSKDMAENNYFSQTSIDGKEPTDRAESAGYNCRKDYGTHYTIGVGENLFQNCLYTSYVTRGVYTSYNWNDIESLSSSTVQGWMDSPGHRKNILDKSYDSMGIGVAISQNDAVYVTQLFC